jgi:hypothetical protein
VIMQFFVMFYRIFNSKIYEIITEIVKKTPLVFQTTKHVYQHIKKTNAERF